MSEEVCPNSTFKIQNSTFNISCALARRLFARNRQPVLGGLVLGRRLVFPFREGWFFDSSPRVPLRFTLGDVAFGALPRFAPNARGKPATNTLDRHPCPATLDRPASAAPDQPAAAAFRVVFGLKSQAFSETANLLQNLLQFCAQHHLGI